MSARLVPPYSVLPPDFGSIHAVVFQSTKRPLRRPTVWLRMQLGDSSSIHRVLVLVLIVPCICAGCCCSPGRLSHGTIHWSGWVTVGMGSTQPTIHLTLKTCRFRSKGRFQSTAGWNQSANR